MRLVHPFREWLQQQYPPSSYASYQLVAKFCCSFSLPILPDYYKIRRFSEYSSTSMNTPFRKLRSTVNLLRPDCWESSLMHIHLAPTCTRKRDERLCIDRVSHQANRASCHWATEHEQHRKQSPYQSRYCAKQQIFAHHMVGLQVMDGFHVGCRCITNNCTNLCQVLVFCQNNYSRQITPFVFNQVQVRGLRGLVRRSYRTNFHITILKRGERARSSLEMSDLTFTSRDFP